MFKNMGCFRVGFAWIKFGALLRTAKDPSGSFS
jgi:hypothetical protein